MRKGYDLTIASFILGTCLTLLFQTIQTKDIHSQTKEIKKQTEIQEQQAHEQTK